MTTHAAVRDGFVEQVRSGQPVNRHCQARFLTTDRPGIVEVAIDVAIDYLGTPGLPVPIQPMTYTLRLSLTELFIHIDSWLDGELDASSMPMYPGHNVALVHVDLPDETFFPGHTRPGIGDAGITLRYRSQDFVLGLDAIDWMVAQIAVPEPA